MKTLTTKITASGCVGCPAQGSLAGQSVRVNTQALVPSQQLPSETYAEGEVVLTTLGHGTFLIRRRKPSSSNRCPLLNYEVRRIDRAEPTGPTPVRPAESSATEWMERAACQNLLKLALARQV